MPDVALLEQPLLGHDDPETGMMEPNALHNKQQPLMPDSDAQRKASDSPPVGGPKQADTPGYFSPPDDAPKHEKVAVAVFAVAYGIMCLPLGLCFLPGMSRGTDVVGLGFVLALLVQLLFCVGGPAAAGHCCLLARRAARGSGDSTTSAGSSTLPLPLLAHMLCVAVVMSARPFFPKWASERARIAMGFLPVWSHAPSQDEASFGDVSLVGMAMLPAACICCIVLACRRMCVCKAHSSVRCCSACCRCSSMWGPRSFWPSLRH
jgi:hypothetical protein